MKHSMTNLLASKIASYQMSVEGILNEIGFLKASDIKEERNVEIPLDIKIECELLIRKDFVDERRRR